METAFGIPMETELTEQVIFDHVARHLATQRKQAFDPNSDVCRYRTKDDDKWAACAVGACLLDSEYVPDMEGRSVHLLRAHLPARFKPFVNILDALQGVHDLAMRERDYDGFIADQLRMVAKDFQLDNKEVVPE